MRGQLPPVVEREVIRRPMRRECRHGPEHAGAPPDLLAIAAVLRREHELLLHAVVVAVRPAVVAALDHTQQLLGREVCALLRREAPRPVLAQLIAPVLGRIDAAAGGVDCDAIRIADARGIALRRRELLAGLLRAVAPDPRARLELRAGIDPRRAQHAVLSLTVV